MRSDADVRCWWMQNAATQDYVSRLPGQATSWNAGWPPCSTMAASACRERRAGAISTPITAAFRTSRRFTCREGLHGAQRELIPSQWLGQGRRDRACRMAAFADGTRAALCGAGRGQRLAHAPA